MNERFMNLDDLDKYGQNLITYSDYVNDSMNKIAAGFNNLYSAKIIQGRRAQVFINVYYEMEESRKNVVDKLYEVKEFVDTVNSAMKNLDSEQAKKLQASLEEMGIKRGKGGTSGGGSTSGGSEGGGTAPTRTTTEEDEQRVQNELGKTSTEGTTGKGEDTTQNNSSESEPKPTSNQEVVEETSGDNTSPSTPGSNDQTVPGENLGQGEGLSKTSTEHLHAERVPYPNEKIPEGDLDAQYDAYVRRSPMGSKLMSREEFILEHTEMPELQKNYMRQQLIDKSLRSVGENRVSSGNFLKPNETAGQYINRLQTEQYFNSDKPLFSGWYGNDDSTSVNDLYKKTLGHHAMYDRYQNGNIGLTVKETVRVDGQEYTLTVNTDRVPTQKEWNQERMNFLSKVANPDSKIESSRTDYSFFNLDLEKAEKAFNEGH